MTWAARQGLEKPDVQPLVTFKPEYFRHVDGIRRHLQPQDKSETPEKLFGTVEALSGDVGEDGRRAGKVTFALLLPDEEVVRAHGTLTADEYEKAVNAHERGRGYVIFKGMLKRGSRISLINEISDFRELNVDAQDHAAK